jgi:integrase
MKPKKTRKPRRGKSGRRGVTIALTPRGWRASWTDPDTGKRQYQALWSLGVKDEDAAVAWAETRSQTVLARAAALKAGAPRHGSEELAKAIDSFVERPDVRESTRRYHALALGVFATWAKSDGVRETEDLDGPALGRYRDWLLRQPLRAPKKKGRRGAKRETPQKLSPMTVNHRLQVLRTALADWRRAGLLPKLSGDETKDALRPVKNVSPVPKFLRSPAIRKLLEAALRHDAETYRETREEHAGLREPGTTRRHPALAPFVETLLLGGFRVNEAAGLEWTEVNLEAGEIVLPPERTKTARGRVIDLTVTPALSEVLAALKLRSSGRRYVFGEAKEGLTVDVLKSGLRRLVKSHGAPPFTWQDLRRTCGTFLTCSPAIYGGASAWMSAKRLGHSVAVAEARYVGAVSDVPPTAKTLEAAMGIEDLTAEIARRSRGTPTPAQAAEAGA